MIDVKKKTRARKEVKAKKLRKNGEDKHLIRAVEQR